MNSLLLQLELRRWRAAGRKARLWWRDDDARAPTAALDRLLTLAVQHDVPLSLAVVPVGDMDGLAAQLVGRRQLLVLQHGCDHENRRAGPVAGEFPHSWSRLRIATALRDGARRLSAVPCAQAIYVPPWNDAHPQLAAALVDCGFVGWSAAGRLSSSGPPPRVDVHLDLLRWRGGARFRGAGKFLRTLRNELRRRRKADAWDEPIGLLTHHLDHDAAAWSFLDWFLGWSVAQRGLSWAGLEELLAQRRGERAVA